MIPFTQCLRPDGRIREGGFERGEVVEKKARFLLAGGVKFSVEELSTGEVSLTAEVDDGRENPLLAIEVCSNGPGVLRSVDMLVENAWKAMGGAS